MASPLSATRVDASPQERPAIADPVRIRELMLANLFAVFNERDPKRRLDVIARTYTEDIIWSDPDGTIQGHEAMNEQAQQLLDRMPDFVFSAPPDMSTSAAISAFSTSTLECRSSTRS